MNRVGFVALALVGAVSFACGEETQPSGDSSSEVTTEASPSPDKTPKLIVDLPPKLMDFGQSLVVDATANIYGAGRKIPPSPGGGGGGILPPGWQLPKDAGGVATFPRVTGEVTPIVGTAPPNGPEGTKEYSTSVNHYEGLSGIDHEGRQMFLVGVFLGKGAPRDPAPPTLDFTKPAASDLIAPRIGQVFLIGEGNDYRYEIPRGATRLFVGFADGAYGKGPVGYYDNNNGELKVTVAIDRP